MRDYIIMTDSCCDLSQQEVEELELTVLPLSFTIEGKTLLNTPDHADMSPEEFFAKIAAGADFCADYIFRVARPVNFHHAPPAS